MKKITVLTLTAGIALSSFAVSAEAKSNHEDRPWSNVYRVYSPNDETPSQPKYNRTAYYMKVNSMSGLDGYFNAWAALKDGTDVSDGHSYKMRDGQEEFLYNLAVEKYNSGIKVKIDTRRWAEGTARGVWSPDSIRK